MSYIKLFFAVATLALVLISLAVMAVRKILLKREGVETWAKITGFQQSANQGKFNGARCINVTYIAGDGVSCEVRLRQYSGMENLKLGESIRIVYARSRPQIAEIYWDSNGKVVVKDQPSDIC